MEGRKEAFRMYLEQTGTTDALTRVFIKLYEEKDNRPTNKVDALAYLKDNLSNNFPTQAEYDKLLKEVEVSRVKVQEIEEAAKAAQLQVEIEKQLKKVKKGITVPVTSTKTEDMTYKVVEIKTIGDAKSCFEDLTKNQNCKSLLVKCLVVDMFERHSNDAFLSCIRRGLEDPNIPVGIYAADEGDYVTFKEIFDPIIKTHYNLSDFQDILESNWKDSHDGDKQLNFRSHLLLRTRITCARSIEKYNFILKMTDVQLEKLKADVEAELKLLAAEDNVKGRYLELITEKELREELKKKQLLFEDENAQLKAAGAKTSVKGRAIFCNDNKDLVVWVNEEEHLKFIATGEDSIKETFIRLRTVVENCEYLKFKKSAESPIHTITFCPTFLGTAMHVSAVIKVPNVAARAKVDKMATELQICVKPTAVNEEFELTNKPKVNKTELDEIKEFIAAVGKFLVEAQIGSIDEAQVRLQELKCLNPQPGSLLVRHLTKEILEAAKQDDATAKTLVNCIRLGLEDEKLIVGICAANCNAYETCKTIFEPIIKEYYDLKDFSLPGSNWSGNDDSLNFKSHLILRTRITCARSIDAHKFVPAMNETELTTLKKEINDKLVLGAFKKKFPGTFSDLDQLEPDVKKKLEEQQLLFDSENTRLRAAGAEAFSNRAIFYSDDFTVTVWVNEEDHLKFIANVTNETGNTKHVIKDTFTILRSAVEECDVQFKKGDSSSFLKDCYLTFCPTHLSPALHVSAVVKFPNVAARVKVEENAKKLAICVKPTKVKDQLELANKPELNKTEFDGIKDFIAKVGTFLEEAKIKTDDDALARLEELRSLIAPPESLLVTHLTTEIFNNNKGETAQQKSLLDCVRLGLEDEKLPVGIFAADEGAYDKFKVIFEPILVAYYGNKTLNSDSAWVDGSGTDFDAVNSSLILNVRITCARSVDTYLFVSAMDENQLAELKNIVNDKLKDSAFTNIVDGTFSDLDDLPMDVKEELEKQQLLFESDNTRLRAAGATTFSSRAIFYTKDYKAAVWVNEEEHLKFIATGTNDPDPSKSIAVISDAYKLLQKLVENCDLKFKKSDDSSFLKNCYLTFCPTYLGTTLHVSAVVKLAKASARGMVDKIAKTSAEICVKPTTVIDQFEVTNEPKWDKPEYESIVEFVTELDKLLKKEEKLITTIDEAYTSWTTNQTQDSTMDKIKPSAMAELEAEGKGQTRNGKTFLDCIRPGLEDEQMGLFAVEADAYEQFSATFTKYIGIIHGDSLSFPSDGWDGDSTQLKYDDIKKAKSSRITCRRSFKEFPFIPAMNTKNLRELRAKVKVILETYDSEGKFYDLQGIDDTTKTKLKTGGHWFEPVNERLRSVGVKDFTTGRAVFVNKEENLTVWLCEEDHLKFISTDKDGNIAKTFDRLKEAVGKFKKEEFELHATWGWKTFCPTNLGTTIEAAIVLELPKITTGISSGTLKDYCQEQSNMDPVLDFEQLKICEKVLLGHSDHHEIWSKDKFNKEFDVVKGVYELAKSLAAKELQLQ